MLKKAAAFVIDLEGPLCSVLRVVQSMGGLPKDKRISYFFIMEILNIKIRIV